MKKGLIRWITFICILCVAIFTITLPSVAKAASFTVYTTYSQNARVRERPDPNSREIGQLERYKSYEAYDEVPGIGTRYSWYKINYYGRIGYVSSSTTNCVNTDPSIFTFYVTALEKAIVREGPYTNARAIGQILNGASYELYDEVPGIGTRNSWYAINYNGQIGYVSSGTTVINEMSFYWH